MSKVKILAVCLLFILSTCSDEPVDPKPISIVSVSAIGNDILTNEKISTALSETEVVLNTPVNSIFLVSFSKDIDPTTVTASTVQIKKGSVIVATDILVDGKVVIITPDAQLEKETTYVLTFAPSIEAADGGVLTETSPRSFRTQGYPPIDIESVSAVGNDVLTDGKITKTLPDASLASGIARNSTFLVTFSKGIDATTVTAASVQIKKGAEIVAAEILVDGKVVIINPTNQLELETTYVLTFASSIKATGGGILTEIKTRSFRTQDNPIEDGLVAHYTFEGGMAQDMSGMGHNGAITGAVPDKDKSNRTNESLKFSSITDRVYVASPTFFSNPVGTFAAWVKFNSLGTPQYLGSVADEASTAYYMSFIRIDNDNTIGTYWRNNADVTWLKSTTTVTAGVYYHMVLVGDGTKYKIYINGTEIALSEFQGINNGKWISAIGNLDNFSIGTLTMKAPYVVPYLTGNIDEVRLYNRVLGAKEVSLLYTLTK